RDVTPSFYNTFSDLQRLEWVLRCNKQMWDVAKVEYFVPGDEVFFLRTAAKISSHYEWNRARKARAAARYAASQKGASPEAVVAAAGAAAAAAAWIVKDDAALLRSLDELRASRVAAAVAAAAAMSGGMGEAGDAGQEEDEEEDDQHTTIATTILRKAASQPTERGAGEARVSRLPISLSRRSRRYRRRR
ncbi:unnamed protein product, partial [Ectocarpus sp. 4 AP-2014]